MKLIKTASDMRLTRGNMPSSVGFVATMGALHKGHESLIRSAKKDCATVVTSIFVNPSQFEGEQDYKGYPRDMAADLKLLEDWGNDFVFVPSIEDMYPPGGTTVVDTLFLSSVFEGEVRPGHFAGVSTIVAKLFVLVRPDKAYFGQKDAQQAAVIRRLNDDMLFGADIVIKPTVREPDGLACSSRNKFLSPSARRKAQGISKALSSAQALWRTGERRAEELLNSVRRRIQEEDLVLEYAGVVKPDSFTEMDNAETGSLLILAARINGIRLIDNTHLDYSPAIREK